MTTPSGRTNQVGAWRRTRVRVMWQTNDLDEQHCISAAVPPLEMKLITLFLHLLCGYCGLRFGPLCSFCADADDLLACLDNETRGKLALISPCCHQPRLWRLLSVVNRASRDSTAMIHIMYGAKARVSHTCKLIDLNYLDQNSCMWLFSDMEGASEGCWNHLNDLILKIKTRQEINWQRTA